MQNQNRDTQSELNHQSISLKPQFTCSQEAIDFLTEKLQLICFRHGKSIDEILLLAEQNLTYNSDMLEALSITRSLKFLRGQNERKARVEYFWKLPSSSWKCIEKIFFTDHYCQLTLEKLEIQTLKNTHIYINIQKDIEVQPGARRPIARTEGFSYQAWFKGNGGNIIRYCSPHDSHNQFHHKHDYTKIPPEVLKIEAGKWPHVSEFLDEIIMNY